MPRYFFNLRGMQHEVRDPDGDELSDPSAAEHIARGLAHYLAGAIDGDQAAANACWVEVEDGDGAVILSIPVGIPPSPGRSAIARPMVFADHVPHGSASAPHSTG